MDITGVVAAIERRDLLGLIWSMQPDALVRCDMAGNDHDPVMVGKLGTLHVQGNAKLVMMKVHSDESSADECHAECVRSAQADGRFTVTDLVTGQVTSRATVPPEVAQLLTRMGVELGSVPDFPGGVPGA